MGIDNFSTEIVHRTNSFFGWDFYRSSFNPKNGLIVRETEEPKVLDYGMRGTLVQTLMEELVQKLVPPANRPRNDVPYSVKPAGEVAKFFGLRPRTKYKEVYSHINNLWKEKYGEKNKWKYVSEIRELYAFSPVPETIDVKVTDWCGYGCDYCYMDSTKRGTHAPKELLTTLFDGLDLPPYQIAFGGGEPTAHPDFPWFLQYTREKGAVPNYTTAGFIFRDEVLRATNEYCGGLAITYHAFRGAEHFKSVYDKWSKALSSHVQVNVHVLFDDHVVQSLTDLMGVGLKNLNIVLLAYYPGVGRSTNSGLPSRKVYTYDFPKVLPEVVKAGYKIAFSEGLLPYFLSNNFPEVDTKFATRQEGLFSCYVDDKGRVTHSSFSPPEEDSPSIYNSRFQSIWESLSSPRMYRYSPCESCYASSRCNIPDTSHFMACAYAMHNAKVKHSLRVV